MEPILEIESLKKYYGKSTNQTKALDGITFQVMPGDFLGIMGSSGSGKSTLLNCIATVIQPSSGKMMMEGVRVEELKGAKLAEYRGTKIGYLFQNFELLDNLTGRENILLPLSLHNVPKVESKKRLEQLAGYLEIETALDKFPAQMSGGQKQRVAAARALIMNPKIILSFAQQDVMIFLKKMESDAVNRLMAMIPVFYGMTLFILFFLIYYASKFQLEWRRHEFGVYLMMGMRRSRLFAMLFAEDFRSSIITLMIGLPAGVLLSEMISLITARLVGLGIIGHQFSLSWQAVLWTIAGFLLIKLAAFLILSGKITRQEIGSLLVEVPEGTKKQMPTQVYMLGLLFGVVCLGAAYSMAIRGISWVRVDQMGITIVMGLLGTMLLFFGLRSVIGLLLKREKKNCQLYVFNFRQLQENVIQRSNTLAISSLLILAALCCFGAGAAIARFYGNSEQHVLDYTFETYEQDAVTIRKMIAAHHLDSQFSNLFEMKVGYIRTTEDYANAFQMNSVMSALTDLTESEDRNILLNNLSYATYPHLISLSGYNQLLSIAGSPVLELNKNEAVVYMDPEFVSYERKKMLDDILMTKPEVYVDGDPLHLTGTVQTTSLVTDRSITLSFALILPDEVFDYYTQDNYDVYLNGVLNTETAENVSLMTSISEMNEELDKTGLFYESYLQNMGRQLFYMVAASYITIYLAIIFLIIANTVIGVQFLMGQKKSSRRYKTLIHIGATYEILCQSAEKQINWYFGIPTIVAVVSSFFGVRALFSGLLTARTQSNLTEMMLVSVVMIFVLFVIEYMYVTAVKRLSSRHLLTLMVPEREE